MKIRDYIARYKCYDSVECLKRKIPLLMSGENISVTSLNFILGHLGYLDEEAICWGHVCDKCTHSIDIDTRVCSILASDYVRTLINKNRISLEDML